MPLKQLSKDELAYIAGIFDGEGCINFQCIRGSYYIRVLITNTNRDLLEYIQSIFGGDIKKMSRKSGWKQSYVWRLSWSKAIEFLSLIEPWLRVKEDQAHIAFCWDHFRPGRGQGPIQKEKRKEANDVSKYLRECLTFFNKRGTHNLEDPVQRELDRMEDSYAIN